MRARYVVDTNVLIAASSADPTRPSKIDATPADPALRQEVWAWLDRFASSESRVVLDGQDRIMGEYCRKLDFNDFGRQVILAKMSTSAADFVDLEYDRDDEAVLPKALAAIVHDGADKKMVAAALASHGCFGEGCVAFAGDTDWHDWETSLAAHNILLEPIIKAWSRKKHAEKKAR